MDVHTSDADSLIERNDQDVQKEDDRESEEPTIVVYTRRWYVLMVFSLMSTTQGFVWGTWGPIATSTHYTFGWADSDIALLVIWGPIRFILGSPFFTWLQNTKGL